MNLCAVHSQNSCETWRTCHPKYFQNVPVCCHFTVLLEKRPQLSKLKKYPSDGFLFSISALIVKQHNCGLVPAIWSTVNYSWPVDAMPTTASKRIILCWRNMDIYSSGTLFTIFCKIDLCTKVMWWTLVHILSFKITKGDECHYSLLRYVKDGILWGKKELRCT